MVMSEALRKAALSLRGEWEKVDKKKSVSSAEASRLGAAVSAVKLEMVLGGQGEETEALVLYREALETAAQLAALRSDVEGFQRAMEQVKDVYEREGTAPSESLNHMRGLDLMCLLAQNRLGDYHMELERIPAADAASSIYLKWPIQLEQALMVGTYKRIFLAAANMPSPYFAPFFKQLLQTVRDEIAACFEAAYDRLSLAEAARLLFLDGADAQAQLQAIADKRGWKTDSGHLTFTHARSKHDDPAADALTQAQHHLFYAAMLERIP